MLLVEGKNELERILSRKTPIAVAWEKAKLYRCAGCDRRRPWDKGSAWRGSWGAIEAGEEIDTACSEACRLSLPDRVDGETGRRLHWIAYEPLSSSERAKRQTVGMSRSERDALTRERRTVPLAPDWKGSGWCRWCGEKIVDKRAYQMNWHRDCKQTWLLHSDRDVQARFLVERDGNDCWDCRKGGRWWRVDLKLAVYTWEAWPLCMRPDRISWEDRYPKDLALRKVDGVIIGLYSVIEYRRECGSVEVDHEIPLWSIWHLPDDERRKYYGPENLRLRCTCCHKAKSKREAAERAQLKAKGPIDLDRKPRTEAGSSPAP